MRSWLLALLLCAPCAALPYDQVPSPRPGGWVTDQAHMLDPSTLGRINHMLDQLQRSTQTECALVTVDSAGAMNPKTYATALFNRWGIGRAGHNDGALMIVFARDRRVEIETGESARRQLTDDEAARLLRTEVVPRMRQNQPAQALEAGINSMLHELDPAAPAAVPPPTPPPATLSARTAQRGVALPAGSLPVSDFLSFFVAGHHDVLVAAAAGRLRAGVGTRPARRVQCHPLCRVQQEDENRARQSSPAASERRPGRRRESGRRALSAAAVQRLRAAGQQT